jgi:uncharacterized iron-regulated membrane protein
MKLRKSIFWLHLGSGCLAGAAIFFLALTGTILTYERQIIAWQESGYRVVPPVAAVRDLQPHKLISLAAAAEDRPPSALVLHADPRDPVEIDFGRNRLLYLNPYTGSILGCGAVRTRAFFRTVTSLHRWFGVPVRHQPLARAIQGSFALDLIVMILTGIILWWPPFWTASRLRNSLFFRRRLCGRARDWNRHLVLGIWSALPLGIIAVTGVILGFAWATSLLYRIADGAHPAPAYSHRAMESHNSYPTSFATAYLDPIISTAQQQAAGWRSLRVMLPGPSVRTIAIVVDFGNQARPDQLATLVFDRFSGRLMAMHTFSSCSLGKRIRLFVHRIHTGEAGGFAGQTISGLASLCCCGLILTGFLLAIRRLQREKVRRSFDKRT